MQWEHLTATEFAQAARETSICLIAMGVIEKHSEHLPLGTDFLNGHKICCLAAEREPAIVFPPFYFGQIYEARCFPGTITLKPTLLIELIQTVFDEIGRNGINKIVLWNAHGGNGHLLPFLAQSALWQEKPYKLYLPTHHVMPGKEKEWDTILDTPLHGHACECETSISLANHPELVKMDRVPEQPAEPRQRMQVDSNSGIWWYANYPDHYAGDARPASAEKGRRLRELEVEYLAHFVAQVKADTVVSALEREFFERESELRK